jgi:HEAT repeat protein
MPQGAAGKTGDPDEQFLQENGIKTDDAGLLAFLRSKSQYDDDLLNLPRLVRQLGDPVPGKRDEAERKLTAIGLAALPALRQAAKDRDPEIVRRARVCVEEVSKETSWGLPGAAVRVLLRRQPAGTAEALLRWLPYVATDEETEETIWFGLYDMAKRDPRLYGPLAAALGDRLSGRRALAGCILGRLGNADHRAAVRKLLNDPEPMVRLRAAQGLLAGKEKASIQTLIELLVEDNIAVACQAEELLHYLAGEESPPLVLAAGGFQDRKKCQAAWHKWWEQRAPKLHLTGWDAEIRRPGLVLVAGQIRSNNGLSFHIWVCGCDGNIRWQIDEPVEAGSHYVRSFQLLPSGSLLTAVTSDMRVQGKTELRSQAVERDLTGKRIWKTDARENKARELGFCQRLPSGNTFVVTDNTVEEWRPGGERVFLLRREDANPALPIFSTWVLGKLASGRVAGLDRSPGSSKCIVREFDRATGKAVKSLSLGEVPRPPRLVELLANGHYLANNNYLWELDGSGKVIRESTLAGGYLGKPLRSGNVLVAGPPGLFELDRQGRVVWEAVYNGGVEQFTILFPLVRLGFDQPQADAVDLRQSVPYQLKRLESKDRQVRAQGFAGLAQLGAKGEAAIPVLLQKVDNTDPELARCAARTLLALGPQVVTHIEKLVKHPDPEVRRMSSLAVTKYWPESKAALPFLIAALKDKEPTVRRMVVLTLRDISRHTKEVVPALVEALHDEETEVFRYAIYSLVEMGPAGVDAAKDSVPFLLQRFKNRDNDIELRRWAAYGLAKLAPSEPALMAALIEALQGKEGPLIQFYAVDALLELGASGKSAVPALVDLLKARNVLPGTRYNTILALGKMGPVAKEAVSALKELLNDDDAQIRSAVAKALQTIEGPKP